MHTLALVSIATATMLAGLASAAEPGAGEAPLPESLRAPFAWTASEPLLAAPQRPGDPCYSLKDPTIVYHGGRWHLFCTVRGEKRSHRIEYLSFADFADTADVRREMLTISEGFFCAPQVFYFTPQRKWYLVYQASDPAWDPPYRPAFSTTDDIADPASWTKPQPLVDPKPESIQAWLDFWVICDETHAYLFYTSLDGRMWRMRTTLEAFPRGWEEPVVALHADVFEASHTYRLKGLDAYLTIIEAQAGQRRYYKAYLADRLDGPWRPLGDSRERPFASDANVRQAGGHWTDSISHAELLRAGFDERLEVDPANLRVLFQGATLQEMAGKPYGQIPWRLGLLTPAPAAAEGR